MWDLFLIFSALAAYGVYFYFFSKTTHTLRAEESELFTKVEGLPKWKGWLSILLLALSLFVPSLFARVALVSIIVFLHGWDRIRYSRSIKQVQLDESFKRRLSQITMMLDVAKVLLYTYIIRKGL